MEEDSMWTPEEMKIIEEEIAREKEINRLRAENIAKHKAENKFLEEAFEFCFINRWHKTL